MLVYSPPPHEAASGVVVPLVHGLAGDVLGNGNTYVTHLIKNLPESGVTVALLQRGGQGEKSYPDGLTGGSAYRTLQEEVADTTAGLQALAEMGYDDIAPLGFSVGFLLVGAAVTAPDFRRSIRPARVNLVMGLSPTHIKNWMGMADPAGHRRLLDVARRSVGDREEDVPLTLDHRPYGMLWTAEPYLSMSLDSADPLVHIRELSRQGVDLRVAYGTEDPDVSGSWRNTETMMREITRAHPRAKFTRVEGAPHNMEGHEVEVERFVLESLGMGTSSARSQP